MEKEYLEHNEFINPINILREELGKELTEEKGNIVDEVP